MTDAHTPAVLGDETFIGHWLAAIMQGFCSLPAASRPSVPSRRVAETVDEGWQKLARNASGPIKFVAVRYGERVVVGPMPGFRHHHILTVASYLGFPNARPEDQGFSADGETFIGREEAARLALESGQVTKLIAPPNLYSEDCW